MIIGDKVKVKTGLYFDVPSGCWKFPQGYIGIITNIDFRSMHSNFNRYELDNLHGYYFYGEELEPI